MWDARTLETSDVWRILLRGLPAGGRSGFEQLQGRVGRSLEKVRAVSDWVRLFFDEKFAVNAPPPTARLAVFAPGSAARLELWQRVRSKEETRSKRSKKQGSSDLDILCIVEGWPANSPERIELMREFTEYLQDEKRERPNIAGRPQNFKSVWLDRMSKLPHGRFQNKELLLGREYPCPVALRLRGESKRFETWRYWIVFESALLYSYPEKEGADFAKRLEKELAESFFNIDFHLGSKRFPFLWYHAACRYMSEIYLGTIRELVAKEQDKGHPCDPQELMRSIIKLKSVRVLNWSFAIINAIVIYQLSHAGLRLSDEEWRLARTAGMLQSLQLQKILEKESRRLSLARSADKDKALRTESKKMVAEIDRVRNRMLDAYTEYFKWHEEEEAFIPESVTVEEIWAFLEGKPCPEIPLTKALVDLVGSAAILFRKVRDDSIRDTGFAPDFLFY
jgi:hypothetical protein